MIEEILCNVHGPGITCLYVREEILRYIHGVGLTCLYMREEILRYIHGVGLTCCQMLLEECIETGECVASNHLIVKKVQ